MQQTINCIQSDGIWNLGHMTWLHFDTTDQKEKLQYESVLLKTVGEVVN